MTFTDMITAGRQIVEGTLVDTAAISRPVLVSDGAGGQRRTWVTVATGVPCRLGRLGITPREVESATIAVRTLTYWTVAFASGTDVRSTDRITIGTRVFEVVSAGEPTFSVSNRAVCQEIT